MIKSLVLKRTPSLSALRQYPEFDNHEFVISITDKKSGLKAFVAIHSRNLGPAHGGTRMKAYASESEALRDVLNLSKAMSYKSALAGLPYGGAKAVIIFNDPTINREELFKAYAEKLEALHGLFRTGTDVGLTDEDTTVMARYSQYILGLSKPGKGDLSTSKSAALGVYYAIKTAAKHRYGSDELRGRLIGVKGVGKLGAELVRLLSNDGAKIFIADINSDALTAVSSELPEVSVIGPKEIHKQELHIYAPCALGDEFKPSVIKELSCDIVAGGANNQLVNIKAGDELFKRGILYVPDYIANAGGLIFVSEDLEQDGFHIERVERRLRAIEETLNMIFERSEKTGVPTHRVADTIAQERISKGKV